jgi:hypothetical protein
LLKDNMAMVIGVGFVAACIVPILSTMVSMTLVGLPLGVMGFMAYGISIYLAGLVVGQALGDAILSVARPGTVGSPYISMAIGVAILALATSIPYLGVLISMGVVVTGFGGMAMALSEARKG